MTNSELSISHLFQISAVCDFLDLYHNLLLPPANEFNLFSNSSRSLTSSDIIFTLLIYTVNRDDQDGTDSLKCVGTFTNWQKIMKFLFGCHFLITRKISLTVFDIY